MQAISSSFSQVGAISFDQSLGDTRNSPYMTDMDTYRYSTCGQLSPTELPTKWLWEMVQDDSKNIIPQLQAAIWLQHVPEGSCCPHLGRVAVIDQVTDGMFLLLCQRYRTEACS